eukprot:8810529-Ditylum_brightwellii.AAC.1
MLRLSLAINPNTIKPSMCLRRRRSRMTLKNSGFFNGCHTADEADGAYAAVIKNQHDSKRARDRKESGKQHNRAKGPNKHSSWLSNGNHHVTTYHHPGRSNTSSHDGYCPRQDGNQHDSSRYRYDNCQNNQSGWDQNYDCQGSSYASKP